MIVQFKKIKMHNFCSYSDAEVSLVDRGFCAVTGENYCKKDGALSNGSGKSTIWSAICFALTGETVQGIKAHLKNRAIDDETCFVTVYFSVDNDTYIVTRHIAPKSDLKIIKNDVDISGKGIRESEKVLFENLPDLTKDLIASTIIIGQKMPNKMSSYSPSGRKELLEKLTKSDFMIEDIKNRIADRLAVLNTELRQFEDSLLVLNTQKSTTETLLENNKASLSLITPKDYSALISAADIALNNLQKEYNNKDAQVKELIATNDVLNADLIKLSTEKAARSAEELKAYTTVYNKSNTDKVVKQNSISYLNSEIKKLQAVKDTCPTCGQKIPGVLKPDTSEQENQVNILTEEIKTLDIELAKISAKHQEYLRQIEDTYNQVPVIQQKLYDNKTDIMTIQAELQSINQSLIQKRAELDKLKYDRDNDERIAASLRQTIDTLEKDILKQNTTIEITNSGKDSTLEHIAVVKKIDSLVKRDFRGYLLYNIIEYLDARAKEYSEIVFGTDALSVYLDGNALDISYDGKIYESLSGGEQQRVDLILQFAIRELLQTYFNYSSNILVLDEITDNLDVIATSRIFDLITNKLKDVESVFIVSHHSDELELPVDSSIIVVKDENSISTIKEN